VLNDEVWVIVLLSEGFCYLKQSISF
jgi:hypothetical protein